MKLDRRTMLAGLAGLLGGSHAFAQDNDLPVAHGRLANNALALKFQKARPDLPDVNLVGPKGEFGIDKLKGRTILMPLWAEWCTPCLSELTEFARLQQKYRNDKFSIVPVLSGTHKSMTPNDVANVLNTVHAGALAPLMEEYGGDLLVRAMARISKRIVLPCNLLIAPNGTVVGRQIEQDMPMSGMPPWGPRPKEDPEAITRAVAAQPPSLWGKPDGEEFVAAMAAGFLG